MVTVSAWKKTSTALAKAPRLASRGARDAGWRPNERTFERQADAQRGSDPVPALGNTRRSRYTPAMILEISDLERIQEARLRKFDERVSKVGRREDIRARGRPLESNWSTLSCPP